MVKIKESEGFTRGTSGREKTQRRAGGSVGGHEGRPRPRCSRPITYRTPRGARPWIRCLTGYLIPSSQLGCTSYKTPFYR